MVGGASAGKSIDGTVSPLGKSRICAGDVAGLLGIECGSRDDRLYEAYTVIEVLGGFRSVDVLWETV
jgi:hypothetical protein